MNIKDVPSKHFSQRQGQKIKAVILHHTAGSNSLPYFQSNDRQVSIHYLVVKDGTIYKMVDEQMAAHHDGYGKLGAMPNVNWGTLGVEMENLGDGKDPYPDEQIAAVVELCQDIKKRYPEIVFLPHRLTSTTGKIDPSYSWDKLMEKIYKIDSSNTQELEGEVSFLVRGLQRLLKRYGGS